MLKKQISIKVFKFSKFFACFISLLSFLLWTLCPVYAANGDMVQEYTFTVEQMNALLSSSSLSWTASNSAGTQSYNGTLTYTVPDTSSLGTFFAYNNSFSGPAAYNYIFTLSLPFELTCISFSISQFAGFKTYNPSPSGNATYAVTPSGLGYTSIPGFTDSSVSLGDFDFIFDSFTWKVLKSTSSFTSSSGTDETVTSLSLTSHVLLSGASFGIIFGFAEPITYTATASEQQQILAKLDEIMQNQDDNTDKIIQNQDDNTDKIIGFLETPDDSTSQKVDDFNTTIDNSDKKLDDLSDSLAVSVPDLDTDLDTSVIDDNFDSSIISSLFSSIVNNSIILTLMQISLIFAVFGMIIHGKDI